MDEPENKKNPNGEKTTPPSREISNANLFADDIVFSDTEKILFEEDLKNRTATVHGKLMTDDPEKRYSPSKKLNEGGMKAIWEVDDHRTARKVAMALIQDSRIASEEDIDSFLYEARLTANLQHPNIIPIYDIAVDENGNPYFTMKALKGETLGESLKKLRAGNEAYLRQYSRTRLLGIFLKVCNAIDYAHSKGVIHLDLKPSNIIVGDFGEVHVLDWGLSTLITHITEYEGEPISWQSMDDVSLEDGQTLTRYLEQSAQRRERRNVVGGTPGYMSPEQAQGSLVDIDFQTDVYMLGALLYELLTYECPVTGKTVKETLNKTVRGEIPDPGQRTPSRKIPAALSAIAMKALQVDPANRYPTASALISDIQKYQEGFATMAENPTFITHLSLLVKRHKLAVSILAVAVSVIALILSHSFSKIKASQKVAIEARDLATERLAILQEQNAYIADTAKKVAPDYLNLMVREENAYEFDSAEQALDTGLAFDPSLGQGWLKKGKILLAQQRFADAWSILTGGHGHPVDKDASLALARAYKDSTRLSDDRFPDFVAEFQKPDLNDLVPRVFYHYNQTSFDPATHFAALGKCLQLLNPKVESLHFEWAAADAGGWNIDISNNPELDNISPLCGLKIVKLDASHIGAPNLGLLTENALKELRLSHVPLNHLFDLDQMTGLQLLDISNTQIENLINIVKYPQLTSLDISGIEYPAIPPQLIWCRNLQLLTVSYSFRDDPTVQALANRGVIIIYGE